ncbi:cysteinyl leukotriene receptor 1 [Brienomyrus brachyistius]|uniref:cysteinyl leukotriene receptor 1 n=1 Tax=Brienomyrus brachyistius TaxID=42636 RepID=UPI0020B40347|nr:cysteinyl leukotriene receptor 1 [Brienomyrus brachyistius]
MTAPWLTSQPSYVTNASDLFETVISQSHNKTCSSSDSFKFLAYTVTYCIAFPVGLLCNIAALYVFLCLTPKKSANTVFTTNLALSDIGFSLTLPFRLVYYLRGGQWDFPDWLCRLCIFSFYLNLYTSVLFLTGLSVLRCIAVVYAVRSKSLITVRRANRACLGIWMFVALTSLPFLFSGIIKREGKIRCFEPSGLGSWKRILVMNYIALTFGFLLPFFIILVCYSSIIHKLIRSKQRHKRSKKSKQRAIRLMAVILATFLLCFLPYHVVRTIHLHAMVGMNPNHPQWCKIMELLQKVLVVTLCLAAANSCFNPLLYYFSGERFRENIRNSSRLRSRSLTSSFSNGAFQWKGKVSFSL